MALWAARPDLHTPVLRDRLTLVWLRAEAQRLTSERSRASRHGRRARPESSIGKMVGAELNQRIYQFCMDLLGPEGTSVPQLRVWGANAGTGDWRGPPAAVSRANTSSRRYLEVMRNILGERVLGLPGDLRCRRRHAVEGGAPWLSSPVRPLSSRSRPQQALPRRGAKFSAENFDEATVRRLMESEPVSIRWCGGGWGSGTPVSWACRFL